MADLLKVLQSSLGTPTLPDSEDFSDGTSSSGFVTGSQNKPPRECGNCIWMGLASCGNPKVVDDDALEGKMNAEGRFPVDEDDCCNSFQSQGNVLLWVVRHGLTDPDEEGIRGGLIDDPLNANGKEQAHDAAEYLKGKKFQHVISSDMDRAQETADKIRPDQDRYVDKELRPWDVGMFAGKPNDKHKEEFQHYIDNPGDPIPGGESMPQFASRMSKAIDKYITYAREHGPAVIVTHSKNFTQIKRHVENKDRFMKPADEDKINEGGIMVILDEDGALKCEIVYNRGDGKDRNWS